MNTEIPMEPDSFYGWYETQREKLYESADRVDTLRSIRSMWVVEPFTKVIEGELVMGEQECIAVRSSLHIQGDLILKGEQEKLVVLGDLTVDGHLIAMGWDYSLVFVGGNLACSNMATNQEIFCLGEVRVDKMAVTVGNDHSAVASGLRAKQWVSIQGRQDFWGEVKVQKNMSSRPWTEDHQNKVSTLLKNSRFLDQLKTAAFSAPFETW
jgi:hypothetical protein